VTVPLSQVTQLGLLFDVLFAKHSNNGSIKNVTLLVQSQLRIKVSRGWGVEGERGQI